MCIWYNTAFTQRSNNSRRKIEVLCTTNIDIHICMPAGMTYTVTHSHCYRLIIPVLFALTTDNESDEVLLLHPSPRLWRNPSTTLETVSATDPVIVLDASAATTGADWSPEDELLIKGKILSDLKTRQHCSLCNYHTCSLTD